MSKARADWPLQNHNKAAAATSRNLSLFFEKWTADPHQAARQLGLHRHRAGGSLFDFEAAWTTHTPEAGAAEGHCSR